VIKQIPRLLGPGLNKAGKFPSPIAGGKTVEDMVRELLRLFSGLGGEQAASSCQMHCSRAIGNC
jgi:hypothetical protein